MGHKHPWEYGPKIGIAYKVTCQKCDAVSFYNSGGFFEEFCHECGSVGLKTRKRECVLKTEVPRRITVYNSFDTPVWFNGPRITMEAKGKAHV